jgi:excisionase family DNA binding protein
MTAANDRLLPPTEKDSAIARALLQALAPLPRAEDVSVRIYDRAVEIPEALVPALVEAAKLIAEGHAIGVIPTDAEVSAQEAADLLKVSRPYLLNLVKKGVLPCRMVGAHHRIPTGALIVYMREQAPRRRALESLVAETQDLAH